MAEAVQPGLLALSHFHNTLASNFRDFLFFCTGIGHESPVMVLCTDCMLVCAPSHSAELCRQLFLCSDWMEKPSFICPGEAEGCRRWCPA